MIERDLSRKTPLRFNYDVKAINENKGGVDSLLIDIGYSGTSIRGSPTQIQYVNQGGGGPEIDLRNLTVGVSHQVCCPPLSPSPFPLPDERTDSWSDGLYFAWLERLPQRRDARAEAVALSPSLKCIRGDNQRRRMQMSSSTKVKLGRLGGVLVVRRIF